MVSGCRELAFLGIQACLKRPWDDRSKKWCLRLFLNYLALIDLFEMCTRLTKSLNEIGDSGKARLYLSKATEVDTFSFKFS